MATHCNTWQHNLNKLQQPETATHGNTLHLLSVKISQQHTTTHCNTSQHTATHSTCCPSKVFSATRSHTFWADFDFSISSGVGSVNCFCKVNCFSIVSSTVTLHSTFSGDLSFETFSNGCQCLARHFQMDVSISSGVGSVERIQAQKDILKSKLSGDFLW